MPDFKPRVRHSRYSWRHKTTWLGLESIRVCGIGGSLHSISASSQAKSDGWRCVDCISLRTQCV